MTVRHFIDNAPAVTLSATIDNAVASFAVSSLVGFPTSFPYNATVDRGTASAEQMLVTNTVGLTVYVNRNINGLGAYSHTTGATFEHTADAIDFAEANTHINSNNGVHGVAGDVVGTTDAQTLTNKTIDASTATLAAVAAAPGLTVTTDADTTTAWQVKNSLGTVTGKILGDGTLTFNAASLTSATVGGNATVGGTLGVTGLVTASDGVTVTGPANGVALSVIGTDVANAALKVQAAAGATANPFWVVDSNSQDVLYVGTDGGVRIPKGFLAITGVDPAADPLLIKMAALQTARPLVIEDSTAATVFDVKTDGSITTKAIIADSVSATGFGTFGGTVDAASYTLGGQPFSVPQGVSGAAAGTAATGFTDAGTIARALLSGKLVEIRLSLTIGTSITSNASLNVTPDLDCYTVAAAYRPSEAVVAMWGNGAASGDITMGTDGVCTIRTASTTISSGTLLATFMFIKA